MKFFCEYCGCRLDAEQDDKCPNCGASYNKNKTFIRLEEEKKQREEKNEALKAEATKTAIKGVKAVKWIFIIPFVVFIIIFVTVVINFSRPNKQNHFELNDSINEIEQDFEDLLDDTTQEDETKIESVTVTGLNNYANIDEYGFMVTGYEVVTSKWKDDYTGDNECVKFYFQVKNTSSKEIRSEDVNCIVDGVAQNQSMFGHNTMTYFIGKDLTVKGDMEFMVPKNATSYDIKYGDYIIVHIEK